MEKLNNTSVMGKILEVFLDAFGQKCKERFEQLTVEKKLLIPALEEPIIKESADKSKEADDERFV